MANVSVSNTTGLYIGSGAASVLNNAQQLLGLLSNNGGVVFSLDPTTSNTKVQGNAQAGGGNYGNANVAAFLPTYTGAMTSMTGAVTTTANVTGAFILGNGSQLTGLGATYSNTNVAAFLPTYTGAISSMTGNLTTTANVQGAFILGNGSQLTGIVASSTYSNTNVAAFLPTYTGAMTAMTGAVTTTANVSGAYILGNGSQLTGLGATYSNTNVAAFLPTYTGAISSMTGNLTTTANVQGAFLLGNGSQITGITTNYSNTNVAAFLPTYTGAMTSMTGAVTTTANIQGAFILGNGSQLTGLPATYSNTNVAAFLPTYTGAMTSMNGNLTTTANVQGAFILGNGSALTSVAAATAVTAQFVTGLTGANVTTALGYVPLDSNSASTYSNTNVAAFLPTYTGAINSLTGNVTTTANVQGAFILGNGSQLTGLAATYSNTNVAAFLPTYTGAMTSMTGNVTTTANVSGAYILGNGSALTSVAAATATTAQFVTGLTSANVTTALGYVPLDSNAASTYSNTNVAAFLPTYNGLLGGTLSTASQPNITAVGTLTSLIATNDIATTSGRFIGNGSGLTAITGANVSGTVANATNAVTAQFVTGLTGANVTTALGYVPLDSNSSVVSAGLATFVTGNAQANITSVGTLTNLTVTGNITSATGTFTGNGSGLTGNIIARRTQNTDYGPTSPNVSIESNGSISFYANTNLQFLAQTGTINLYGPVHGFANADIDGNLTASNIVTTGVAGNITGANYISGNFFVGNGAFLTGISSVSTYGNANVAAFLPTYTGAISSMTGNVTTTANVQGAYFIGNGSQLTGISGGSSYGDSNVALFLPNYTGAITSMTGNVTTTANVSASYFIGNGSQLTGITGGNATPGGSTTFIQFNNASTFDGSANLIYEPADGNITLGNLVFNKNYNRILQTNAFDTTVQSATQNATGQFIIGDGWNGNVTSPTFNNNQTIDGAFVLVNKSFTKTDNGRRAAGFGLQTFVNVTANMTNTGTRITGLAVMPRIGGNTTQTALNSSAVVGTNTLLTVGGGTSTFASLGNANLRIATGTSSTVEPVAGSFIGNAYAYQAQVAGTASGQFLTRAIGYTVLSQGTSNATPSFYGYHMPNNTSYGGININNSMRASAEYYFLYNEDDVAQVRLGSLRRYTEYRANITSSSGNLTIDKAVAQVQYLTPTETVNNVSFTNFITSANDGTNNDTQTDTVTLIVQQGSTPYNITMPNGVEYKYAGGVTTVGNTANSVTMISTTATKNVSGATDLYLITISPEFV